jgi:anthranilate phosphoribosyltransferase
MMQELIRRVDAGGHLSVQEAENAMEEILSGRVDENSIVSLLAALRTKVETFEELVGFARAMRRHATSIVPANLRDHELLVDTCGTGGDASGTFNISTAAAFVVAGAGVRVAKHGNRSISSKSGSADVLEALGVAIDIPPQRVAESIEKVGIGFLYAPAMHTAMKHAMPARRRLGGRTAFNLLGPLTNPAGARAQIIGVFATDLVETMARTLAALGAERAFIVHGADGLDEITTSRETHIGEVHHGTVRMFNVSPEDFGLPLAPLSAISGGSAADNAAMIRMILDGETGPRRDVVLANAAAALVAAGAAPDFLEGARLSATSIDSGAARQKLDALIEFTKRE